MPNLYRRLTCLALALYASTLTAAEWPQFRGPTGQGHSTAMGLPLKWGETENVTWKTPIPGRGWSSPVVSGNQIWLTTAIERPATEEEIAKKKEGRRDAGMLSIVGSVTMRAICVDRNSGRIVRDIELFQVDDPPAIHQLNSFASPTPILEDGKLYCHFGTFGTTCVDTKTGTIDWTNQTLRLEHQNGPGGSPVVWRDLLIINCDGIDVQYVAALDKQSGELRWKTRRSGKMADRVEFRKAYCTPLVIEDGGRAQVVSPGADWVYSYDPKTGKELWRAAYGKLGFSNVARPIASDGVVYVCSCFMKSSMFAIRYDGDGDVTDSHIEWSFDKQMPNMPSPILVEGRIYVANDSGVLTCLEAKSGEELWRGRLDGNHSASPVAADGRIYFFNRGGESIVIQPGDEYKELARNQLDGSFMGSPAIVGRAFYIRTNTHLYRIEEARTASTK